jgi:hypothetical protein
MVAVQRIGWTPLPDGRVRQHWETSNDVRQDVDDRVRTATTRRVN